MSRYSLIFLLMAILTPACYHTAPEPEFNRKLVLPPDKMESLLTDLQLVDAAVNLKQRDGLPPEETAEPYFEEVLKEHHVSREEFEESMRYYAYHLDELQAIYEQVIVKLSEMEIGIKQDKDTTSPGP